MNISSFRIDPTLPIDVNDEEMLREIGRRLAEEVDMLFMKNLFFRYGSEEIRNDFKPAGVVVIEGKCRPCPDTNQEGEGPHPALPILGKMEREESAHTAHPVQEDGMGVGRGDGDGIQMEDGR